MLKLICSVLSAINALLGIRRALGFGCSASVSHAATPSTSFVYRWSGADNAPRSQELILGVGNQEARTIIISDIFWSSRASHVKWGATYEVESVGSLLQQGQGKKFALEPSTTLEPVAGSRYCKHFINQLRLVCGLHLVVCLQSGEAVTLRAPRAYRSFLAHALGFGRAARAAVFLHGYAWP